MIKYPIPFMCATSVQLFENESTDEKSRNENDIEEGHDAKGRHAHDQSSSGFHFQLAKFLLTYVNGHWRNNSRVIVCIVAVIRDTSSFIPRRFYGPRFT